MQVSIPLAGERLRASIAVRYVGSRLVAPGADANGYAIADLTFTSRNILPGVNVTAAVRNLFDRQYQDASLFAGGISADLSWRGERSLWLSLGYSFE
jgi:iron complex outermembrane receptor protein